MLRQNPDVHDSDPQETQDWMESLEAVWRTGGKERLHFLLNRYENSLQIPRCHSPKVLPLQYY